MRLGAHHEYALPGLLQTFSQRIARSSSFTGGWIYLTILSNLII